MKFFNIKILVEENLVVVLTKLSGYRLKADAASGSDKT